jgi:hypothetical protein
MLSEKARREEQLSVLERLKKKGVPSKTNEMNTMFELGVDEDGRIAQADVEEEETPPEEDTVPYAPGKRMPKKALTPLPVGGGPARPKKKVSLT